MELELYYYGENNLELLKSIFKKRNFIYTTNQDTTFKEYSFIFNQSIVSLNYNTNDVELKNDIKTINIENNINTNTKLNIELNDNYFSIILIKIIDELINSGITDIILIDEYENIIFKRNNDINVIDVTGNFPFNLLKCNYNEGVYLSYIIKMPTTDYSLQNIQQIVLKIINSFFNVNYVNTDIIYEKYFSTEIFSFSISNERIIIKYLHNFNNQNQHIIKSIIFNIIKNLKSRCILLCSYDIINHKNININLNYSENDLISIEWNNF